MYRTSAQENRSLLLMGGASKIVAIRRDNGQIEWRFGHDDLYGYYVDFVIVESRVFVPCGESVVCLDYETGKVIGQSALPSRVVRLFHDEGLMFAVGDPETHCLDLNGNRLWSAPTVFNTSAMMPTMGFPGNVVYGFRDSG